MTAKNDLCSRNVTIDILRAFGLLCIILAHVNAPKWLMEIRSFDVPLLTFLAGLSFTISTKNQTIKYFQYLIKRVKKLLIPTWIVLAVIFVVAFFVCWDEYPFSKPIIVESFLLFDGIGYVWFVRVTLMLAVMSPLLAKLNRKTKKEYVTFVFLAVWVMIYIGILWINNNVSLPRVISLFLYHGVIFFLGYGLIYYIGMRFSSMSNAAKIIIVLLSFVLLVFCLINNGISITDDKYPPGAKYISYGLCVSFLLFFVIDRIKLQSIPFILTFLSRNSFTIYLLHIPPILFLKYSNGSFAEFVKSSFILEYLFLLVISFLMTASVDSLKKVLKKAGKK